MSILNPPSRILFLDIDGVLNSTRSALAFDGTPHSFRSACMGQFDMVAVALVRRLCEVTGTAVVLSSDWRYNTTAHLTANALNLPVVDVTPCLPASRGVEIDTWLAAHPEVTAYAIVDDNGGMLPKQAPHFVKTDANFGLTLADYRALKGILNGHLWPEQPSLKKQLAEALALAAHWKANHAHMAARCALLSQRPDLPVDRLPAYRELVRLQELSK
jgi:hypothetical protein